MPEFMPQTCMNDEDCMDDEDLEDETLDEDVSFISLPNPSIKSMQHRHAPPPRAEFLPPVDDPEVLRVLAVGSRTVVNIFVHRLHQAGIVQFNEWSRLLPTPNPGEFMRLLTKRIPLDTVPGARRDRNP
ncbi:hypothetical protein H6F67_21590 [Microcoleus sp. FACHB-1515]|uniref:hypothetical protein n=1 Tax=Cyanophyceae TaxID=3028117 RepID=UPI0016849E5D|nr:hypothetical protein [Microcoleus sp. FACHB-1515]MBD2092444.1 hypothetical protein [Microcoleus sp. FACHB-1515]